jgi:hypothetical protein
MVYYLRHATGGRRCAWSLVATTSRVLTLCLALLQDMMIESLSLFVLDPYLTFLSSACISFTTNQVYSLVHVYHWSVSLWVRKCLPTTILLYWCSCIGYVYPVPSLVSFTSEPCHIDLTRDLVYPSCSTYLRGCYPQSHQRLPWFRNSCTNGRCRPRPRNWRRSFPSRASDQINGPRRSSNEA